MMHGMNSANLWKMYNEEWINSCVYFVNTCMTVCWCCMLMYRACDTEPGPSGAQGLLPLRNQTPVWHGGEWSGVEWTWGGLASCEIMSKTVYDQSKNGMVYVRIQISGNIMNDLRLAFSVFSTNAATQWPAPTTPTSNYTEIFTPADSEIPLAYVERTI